jgi:hypothetical protein
MHAVVTNWRIKPDTQADEAYAAFLTEAARRVVPILRDQGMLDVFVIRIAPDLVKFVNIYESKEEADVALALITERVGPYLVQHLNLMERSDGSAVDLTALTDPNG